MLNVKCYRIYYVYTVEKMVWLHLKCLLACWKFYANGCELWLISLGVLGYYCCEENSGLFL